MSCVIHTERLWDSLHHHASLHTALIEKVFPIFSLSLSAFLIFFSVQCSSTRRIVSPLSVYQLSLNVRNIKAVERRRRLFLSSLRFISSSMPSWDTAAAAMMKENSSKFQQRKNFVVNFCCCCLILRYQLAMIPLPVYCKNFMNSLFSLMNFLSLRHIEFPN